MKKRSRKTIWTTAAVLALAAAFLPLAGLDTAAGDVYGADVYGDAYTDGDDTGIIVLEPTVFNSETPAEADAHTCEWSPRWTNADNKHYFTCTVENCDAKTNEGDCGGTLNDPCETCGYHGGTAHTGWEELTSTTLSGGKYYLGGDIIGKNITVNSGTVWLCLNGNVLKGTGSGSSNVIWIGGEDVTLYLCDCNGSSGTHYFTDTEGDGCWDWAQDANGSEGNIVASVTGGVITGGKTSSNGGGVGVTNGNGTMFVMTGGTIAGNTAASGGGVHVYNTPKGFTMTGGKICGNTASNNGGGVNASGKFVMSGGTISDNKAGKGGGVYVNDTSTMTGGTISGNTATGNGGGVHVTGTFEMSGSPTIGDEVYFSSSRKITITGALSLPEPIRVVHGNTGSVLTSGFGENHPNVDEADLPQYFVSDEDGCTLILENGEVKYTTAYKVTFDLSGGAAADGSNAIEQQTVARSRKATKPDDPTKTGYTFAGWKSGSTAWDFESKTVTANTMLTAQWTVNQYTITFDTAGGTAIDDITQDYGTAVTAPANPTKTGHTFAGWDKTIPTTMPAEDVTITARWTINQYKITFDTAGGTAIDDITQDYGTAVTAPANPTKTGYTFAGWDAEVPATMPAEDVTITAQWTANRYTITFDTVGGSTIAPITAEYNMEVDAPANDPTREGYTFAGWDKEFPLSVPVEGVLVTAQWTVNRYTITVYATEDDTEPYQIITQDYGTKVTEPAKPTRTGYTFAGWDAAFPATMPARDMVITAQWTKKSTPTVRPGNNGSSGGAPVAPVKPPVAEVPPVVDLGADMFDDVVRDEWYYDSVDYVVKNGIMQGITDALFDPNGTADRAQIVMTLWRLEKEPTVSHPLYFADVSPDAWYGNALRWANSEELVLGYGDGRFGTGDPITREQIATILWRYARFKGVDTSSGEGVSLLKFADARMVSDYAIAALQWACSEDVIRGTVNPRGELLLDPQGSATRAQIAAILMRFCENIL